jgi:hypothetical protein
MVIDEIEKIVEGNGHTIPAFVWRDLGKPQKPQSGYLGQDLKQVPSTGKS